MNVKLQSQDKKDVEIVKDSIINPILKGESVLQMDRPPGIDFPHNAINGTVYEGANCLLCQQFRADNKDSEGKGFKSPLFMTTQQTHDLYMLPHQDTKALNISCYVKMRVHKENIYPVGGDGREDRTQAPIHVKGEPIVGSDGKPIGEGFEFYWHRNLEQIDTEHCAQYRRAAKSEDEYIAIRTPSNVKIDKYPKMENPYVKRNPEGEVIEIYAKPGQFYKAKNDSGLEVLKEKASHYFNSIITDFPYSKAVFTEEQLQDIAKEKSKNNSQILNVFNDAYNYACGRKKSIVRSNEKTNTKKKAKAKTM